MDMVVCSPNDFYKSKMNKFITRQCNDISSQWIYQIIDNKLKDTDEVVFHNTPEWVLCLDKHVGQDTRFLIIFKDRSLHTIRDLRQTHVRMLHEIDAFLVQWLGAERSKYSFYFHYMPSVFQLHLHITTVYSTRNTVRMQPLHVVIRNIEQDSLYYHKALIYTKYCKTLKKAETHAKIMTHI